MPSKPMPWPIPPGKYIMTQGIAAHLRITQEDKDDMWDPEICCLYMKEDHIVAEVSGQGRVNSFDRLPAAIQKAVKDRFEELFALENKDGDKGPRGSRVAYYSARPAEIIVEESCEQAVS